jgi:isopenicillin-N N-acyltransferase like protein
MIELTGSHYEMGKQHAQKLLQYRTAISDLIEAHRKKIQTYPQGATSGTRKEMEDALSVHSPRTLDLIHGIADGFGLSRNDLLSMMIGSYYEDKLTSLEEKDSHEDGCTTWAYSGKKGEGEGILLAKNRDYLISHRGLQVVFRCKPDKGGEYFSVNSIGACNVFSSGMNRQGLAIADTRVPSFDAGPGLPRYSLMMHILEDFKYVAEAVDYLKSAPRMGGGNLVFADAAGNIGSAEVGYQSLDLLQKDHGYLVCTNHFEGPSMRKEYRQKDREKEKDSKARYGEVLRRLSGMGQELTPSQAKGLMSFHGETFSVCNHGDDNGAEKTSTISSTLFLPLKKGFYYCEGFPCNMPYRWISF